MCAFTGCSVRILVIALISLVDRDEVVQADTLAGEHLSGGINLEKQIFPITQMKSS